MDAGKRSVLQQEHRPTQRGSERESEASVKQARAHVRTNGRLTDELFCDGLLLPGYRADDTHTLLILAVR